MLEYWVTDHNWGLTQALDFRKGETEGIFGSDSAKIAVT
jgi:hypothetical protein